MRLSMIFAVGAVALAATAAAYGAGSIINSFCALSAQIVDGGGVFRDADYVYAVFDLGGDYYACRFTPTGTPYGSRPLYDVSNARDADHSPFGEGCFGFRAGERYIFHYALSTGSRVGLWNLDKGTTAYGYLPGSDCFYAGKGTYIYRYTTSGSFVSSFETWENAWANSIAVASSYGGVSGEFILMLPYGSEIALAHVYEPSGSLVATFPAPDAWSLGSVCGPGYPTSYGTTLWCSFSVSGDVWVYQVDVGGNVAVTPASVGRIKALFE